MLGFLNEKIIILIGFIIFVALIYLIFSKMLNQYLSKIINSTISKIESQKQLLTHLKQKSQNLNNQIELLTDKYEQQINNIKQENNLFIEQHKSISIISTEDQKNIKKYLNEQLNNKIITLQENIIKTSMEKIKKELQNNKEKLEINSINKQLKKILNKTH